MSNKFNGIAILMLLLFASCEKVVDIPLNETEQRIVVEAVGKSLEGESFVLLSKSIQSAQGPNTVERLSGASVVIADAAGNQFVFEEGTTGGKYRHPTFAGQENTNYFLTVDYEGSRLTASAKSKTVPQIDSLFVFQNIGGPGAADDDTTNVLIYTVTDNPNEKNFYRFVLWVNGEKNNTIFIETDDLGNGETYTSPFFGVSFDSNDEVYAELWSMEKENYAYFSTLFSNLNQGPFSAAPSDPDSNIEGGGIGYFGMFMVDTMSITIP